MAIRNTINPSLLSRGRQSGSTYRHSDVYPDPCFDWGNIALPDNVDDARDIGEMFRYSIPPYARCTDRKAAYIVNDIDVVLNVSVEDPRAVKQVQNILKYDIGGLGSSRGMVNHMIYHQVELDTYGEHYTSTLKKVNRKIICQNCGWSTGFRRFATNPASMYKFNLGSDFASSVSGKCANCGKFVNWNKLDVFSKDPKDIYIRTWPAKEMEVYHDPFSNSISGYLWKIPQDYRNSVKEGHWHVIEQVEDVVLEAIHLDYHLFIDEEAIFYSRDMAPSGVKIRGRGISPAALCSREAFSYATIRRQHEAVLLDHILGMRVISPQPRMGTSDTITADPFKISGPEVVKDHIKALINHHRADPNAYHLSPIPLQYSVYGADANALANIDLLNSSEESLLNAAGFPPNIYRLDLSSPAAPAAIKLFERINTSRISDQDAFIQYHVDNICSYLGLPSCIARSKKMSLVEDPIRQQLLLQANQSGKISDSTAYQEAFGIDTSDEFKKILRETAQYAQLKTEMQRSLEEGEAIGSLMTMPPVPLSVLQQAQGQGSPEQGGAQPAAGGDPASQGMGPAQQSFASAAPADPETMNVTEFEEMANSLAQEGMIHRVSSGGARAYLSGIRAKFGDAMHRQVRVIMDQMASQARSEGGKQVLQQQFGGDQ